MLKVQFTHKGIAQESEVFNITAIPIPKQTIIGTNREIGFQYVGLVCSIDGEMLTVDINKCNPSRQSFGVPIDRKYIKSNSENLDLGNSQKN